MTVGVATALAWSTAEIDAAAARLARWGTDVDWCTTDFGTTTDIGAAWRGAAASSATLQAERIAAGIQRLALSLTDSSTAVRAANGRLADAQSRLRSVGAQVAALGNTLGDDGTVSVAPFVSTAPAQSTQLQLDQQAYNGCVALARSLSATAQEALHDCVVAEQAVARALRDALDTPRRLTRGWVLDESSLLQCTFDPAVQGSMDRLHNLMAHPGDNASRLRNLAQALQHMTADQLAAFFAACSDTEMAALDHFLTQQSASGGALWWSWHTGLTDAERNALFNALAQRMDLPSLHDLRNRLPFETDMYLKGWCDNHNLDDLLHWEALSAPLFHAGDTIDPGDDVNQGGDGDCWYLSALNAVIQHHPDVIVNNITTNANGTYTVRFYVNGTWVPVTVLPDIPVRPNGSTVYAHPGTNGTVSWPQVYEKAYAQLRSGYQGINGGWPTTSLPALLGPDYRVSKQDSTAVDLSHLAHLLQSGAPMTACTHGGSDKEFLDPAGHIVGNHAYAVLAVDPHAGTITLRNPWGGHGTLSTITVTTADFRTYFSEVEYAELTQ